MEAVEPICEIARLSGGGDVPLDCLFGCPHNCMDLHMKSFYEHHGCEPEDLDDQGGDPRPPRCNRCGSTEVRWRQQTGKWVLFSLQPGKVHVCPLEDDFEVQS